MVQGAVASGRKPHDLRLAGIRKRYGSVEAVRGIDLDVKAGTMVSLIGPSGCGKTTTLRMIAGLESLSAGTILSGGLVLSDSERSVPPERRDMGMVFQTYALWPHMNVAENVAYGLKRKGVSRPAIGERVRGALDLVNMTPFSERYPHQLSGGQQQRVALARAISSAPRILLFDEPLSNLDAVLREQMRFEIRTLQQRLGITSVYVTHSQDEALALSDQIVVMRDGSIAQIGAPREIYDVPRNEFVAGFIGLANILTVTSPATDGILVRGRLRGGDVVAAGAGQRVEDVASSAMKLSVRPSEIRILKANQPVSPGFNTLSGIIRTSVFTGGLVDYFVELSNQPDTVLRVQAMAPPTADAGERVILEFDPRRTVALEDRENGVVT